MIDIMIRALGFDNIFDMPYIYIITIYVIYIITKT